MTTQSGVDLPNPGEVPEAMSVSNDVPHADQTHGPFAEMEQFVFGPNPDEGVTDNWRQGFVSFSRILAQDSN